MADIPRLNGVIRALEKGQHAFTAFSPADVESAIALATSKYDGVVFEKDIGQRTAFLAPRLRAFNPDQTWKKAEIAQSSR